LFLIFFFKGFLKFPPVGGLFCCFILSTGLLRADTFYFFASRDVNNVINYNWFSGNNWYQPDPLHPGKFVQVGQLPQPTDIAVVETDVNAVGNDIHLAGLIVTTSSGVISAVSGGNFIVGTLQADPGTVFTGSSIEVSIQMSTSNLELDGVGLTIESGASWLLGTNSATGRNSVVGLSATTIENVGQIVFTDGTGMSASGGGAGPSTILNRATVSSSGSALVTGTLIFDQGGTVRGDVGTLTFTSAIWTNSTANLSKFRTTATNAMIVIYGLSTVPSGSTFVFSGPGLTLLKGAPATIQGSLQVGVADPATHILDVGTVECDVGMTGTGRVQVVASNGFPSTLNLMWPSAISVSTINIDAGGKLNLITASGEDVSFSGVTVNNSGTTTWSGGSDLELDGNSIFNNLAGALFDAQSDGHIFAESGTNIIFNGGTFQKSGGAGDVILQPLGGLMNFNNMGLLDVQTGRVLLQGGTNSGQLNVSSGAQLRFRSGTFLLSPGSSLTGPGTFALGGSSPTLLLGTNVAVGLFMMDDTSATLDGSGNLTISGAFNWSGGTIQGGGSVNIASGVNMVISGGTMHRAVNNAGMAGFGVGAGLLAGNGASFNNSAGGVCAMQSGSSITYDGSGAWPMFNNAGTLSNAVGSYPIVNATLINSGAVLVQSNRITFNHGYVQTAGTTTVAGGATLELNSSGALISGGTLSGNGVVDGPLTNSANVKPGASPGILNVTYYANAYTQTPKGALAIEIGGLTPGTQFGQLNIGNGGMAQLGGVLNVTFINGFLPVLGESFPIVNFNSGSGKFATVNENIAGNGLVLVPRYSGTNVSLVAANELILSSPLRNLNGFNFAFTSTVGLSNVVEYTDSLMPPVSWQTLTNLPGNGTLIQVLDPVAGRAQRFYRVRFQ
jgi:fibronectin-binding autotransporter adhesin